MIQPGQNAPEFALPDQNGTIRRLEDWRGRKLILYFYPRDLTPGCSLEAAAIRDVFAELITLGYEPVGVSPDAPKTHVRFREKLGLPFDLLSDGEHQAAQAYGAWGEKRMYGKVYMGVIRSTFVIDKKGIVEKVFAKVTPASHGRELVEALKA